MKYVKCKRCDGYGTIKSLTTEPYQLSQKECKECGGTGVVPSNDVAKKIGEWLAVGLLGTGFAVTLALAAKFIMWLF